MLRLVRRWIVYILLAIVAVTLTLRVLQQPYSNSKRSPIDQLINPGLFGTKFRWKNVQQRHPVETLSRLPTGPFVSIPKIQADFEPETREERAERQKRLAAVEEAFIHSWSGYKSNAWLQDEVSPLSGLSSNGFGGWGATLVDSLDTLWIMGLKREFAFAVSELKKINFTTTPLDTLNVFETTIRYLGGLLSAYDLSMHKYKVLLQKAVELGDMLYVAFDTPNRMPVTRWDWQNAALGRDQEAGVHSLFAEVGSMTLEFTRLSQLTGDPKWYDAIARVTDVLHDKQNSTKLPGLWPTRVDVKNLDFRKDTTFTFGGMADSSYEYFPKQYLMLGGRNKHYRTMYNTAIEAAREHLFFQPLNPNNDRMLLAGSMKRKSAENLQFIPQGQHLSCFAGGMVALGAKVFNQSHELDLARQLVDGCLWAYESMPSGVMPEIFTALPCDRQVTGDCTWSSGPWYDAVSFRFRKEEPEVPAQKVIMQKSLPQGIVDVPDSRYLLRPEAIESVFVLYRITGDRTLQGRCSKPSAMPLGQTLRLPPLTTSGENSQHCSTAWRASGRRRRSSISI